MAHRNALAVLLVAAAASLGAGGPEPERRRRPLDGGRLGTARRQGDNGGVRLQSWKPAGFR